jgi:hypothetical protein
MEMYNGFLQKTGKKPLNLWLLPAFSLPDEKPLWCRPHHRYHNKLYQIQKDGAKKLNIVFCKTAMFLQK